MQNSENLKEKPSDGESTTTEEKKKLAFLHVRRFCFIGSFEPARIYRSQQIVVRDVYSVLNESCKLLEPDQIQCILKAASTSKLLRRDELTLVYVIYLLGDASIQHKTKVREEFVKYFETDVDLFLFCKYAALVHKVLKRKIFCKTIKKAISAWYMSKSSEALSDMFRTNRGRNGFTHRGLIRMCRIPDHVLGNQYVYDAFNEKCTALVNKKDCAIPSPPKPKVKKQKIPEKLTKKINNKINQNSVTSSASNEVLKEQEEVNKNEEVAIIPPKQCNIEEIHSKVLAISELRTTTEVEKAVDLITNFNLKYEHLPYHLLQYSNILKKVIPSMTCMQLLRCFNSENTRKHFAKQEIMKVCREKFLKKNALKDEGVDPIMCLVNLDKLSIADPLKPTNNKKTNRAKIISFSKQLFKNSFLDTKPMNLNVHITINMQNSYMRKTLTNSKCMRYKVAAISLAFTFFKVEEICDVFRWCENAEKLEPVEFKKSFEYEQAYNEVFKVNNLKNKQRLYLPIDDAMKRKDNKEYDLFICIVPAATRGNKKQCSEFLAESLNKYRQNSKKNTKMVIVDLLRFNKSMSYDKASCENILEICGLDEHTVRTIQNFALGHFD